MKVIYSLCDYSGVWSKPYDDHPDYSVVRVDLQHGQDVRLMPYPEEKAYGVLAAPPCDAFAVSGARWWASKGEGALLDGLALVDACMRFILVNQPTFWCLENPVGRLRHYIGAPTMWFDPCDYGDPYTKKTGLWGTFNKPKKYPVPATEGSKMHLMAPGPERKNMRSETPIGFSKAFFAANP
jgi:hypothetical protein